MVPAPTLIARRPLAPLSAQGAPGHAAPASSAMSTCKDCAIRRVCALQSELPAHRAHLEDMALARRRLSKGEALFRAGDAFHNLYVVHSGSFKKSIVLADGREQITGFFIAGDVLALSGISTGRYASDAVALEDSTACILPFDALQPSGDQSSGMERHWHRMLGTVILRERMTNAILGTLHADERIAAFLLDLSQRWQARGYSASEFVLKMTRADIGCYLGIKLETVSRALQSLHRRALIEVRTKDIRILDLAGLAALQGLLE
jgi:CRP/FNR family transcriptional regulator